jgi:hypothetical protein
MRLPSLLNACLMRPVSRRFDSATRTMARTGYCKSEREREVTLSGPAVSSVLITVLR